MGGEKTLQVLTKRKIITPIHKDTWEDQQCFGKLY